LLLTPSSEDHLSCSYLELNPLPFFNLILPEPVSLFYVIFETWKLFDVFIDEQSLFCLELQDKRFAHKKYPSSVSFSVRNVSWSF